MGRYWVWVGSSDRTLRTAKYIYTLGVYIGLVYIVIGSSGQLSIGYYYIECGLGQLIGSSRQLSIGYILGVDWVK